MTTIVIACSHCFADLVLVDGIDGAVYPTLDGEMDWNCEPECWPVCNAQCGADLIAAGPPVDVGAPNGFFYAEQRRKEPR